MRGFTSRSRQFAFSMALAAAALAAASSEAAVFTYSRTTGNTSGTADQWSAGTNWSPGVPVSAADTTLVFSGNLAASTTVFTNNDIAGNFLLNRLEMVYAGPAAGTAPTVTISGNPLEFVLNGAVAPTMVFNTTGTVKPTVTINNAIVLTDDTAVSATTNATFGGKFSGGGDFTKSGLGTITINALLANPGTTSGDFTVQEGALNLSFASVASAFNDILGPTTSLILGGSVNNLSGASMTITGRNAAITDTQTFADTTAGTGRNTLTANRGGTSNTLTVNLGALGRQTAGLINFVSNGATATFTTTTGNTNGILGAYATIGADWAANTAGTITAYTAYTDLPAVSPTLSSDGTTNVRITGTTGDPVTFAATTGTTDVNTLQIADVNARTLTIPAGAVLRVGANGGIWRSVAAATTTVVTITGGQITAGGANNTASELILRMDGSVNNAANTAQLFSVIDSEITNNGTGVVTLVKTGPQGLTLTATNSYTGPTYILQGTLHSTVSNGLGSGDIHVYSDGATQGQAFVAGATYDNDFFITGAGPGVRFGSITASAGAIRMGATTTLNGTITLMGNANISNTSNGSIAIIAGQITGNFGIAFNAAGNLGTNIRLTNPANNWTGDTTVAGQGSSGSTGTIFRIGADEVVPHGSGKGNLQIVQPNSTNPATRVLLEGHTETVNAINSSGTLQLDNRPSIENGTASTQGVLIFGANGANGIYRGQFINGGGTLSLQKIGAGTQITSGISTHSGSTTVAEGTLVIDYTHHGSSLTSSPTNYFSASSAIVLDGGTLAINPRGDGAATAQTATYNVTSVITLPSVAGLVVGQGVTGTNIPAGTFITRINAATNQIFLSAATTVGPTTDTVSTVATTGITNQTFLSLAMDATSTLDLGTGSGTILTFLAETQPVDGSVLNIANWNGTPDVGGGADKLLFTIPDVGLFQTEFAQSEIVFAGFDPGYALIQQGVTTVYEVVPVTTAIPEPASLMVLGLGGMALLARGRRRS